MYDMKRTTIFAEDTLMRQVKAFARRQGVSVAHVVREALSAHIAGASSGSVPSIAGRFSSGASDTASRVDELLWQDPHA